MKSERWKSAALALAILLWNLWLVRRLFTIEYLNHMGSIEGARIAQVRWILENWRDLSWFPLWYGGIPFPNMYPPLCQTLAAALAAIGGLSAPHAYHAEIAVFYALGPVTLFYLVLRLVGNRACGAVSAIAYSVLSPSAFLIPDVARQLGGVWLPGRLQAMVLYGEGPHVAAMTLLLLALLLLIAAFEKLRPVWWLWAAVGIASVLLTNWLGAVELVILLGTWLLANPARPLWKQWLQAAGLGIGAYAIASPWLPPSTVWAFVQSEEFRGGGYASQPAVKLLFLAGALAGLLCLLWLFRRARIPKPLCFAILFLYPTLLITASAIGSDPRLMPHRLRFHLVMELGLALAVGLGLQPVVDRMSRRGKRIAGLVLLGLCVYPAARYAIYARHSIQAVDIHTTVEYQEAKWLDRGFTSGRVFVPGSIRFFLNAFGDVPQFAGGFDPGVLNPTFGAVSYQILSGENAGPREGEIAVLWLKAFAVGAVAVSGPTSREAYPDYRNPHKFEGLLPEVWRDGDDVIYSVPLRSPSLAHVLRPGDLPVRAPENGLDIEPVRPYVAALENPAYPPASFTWLTRHSAAISAPVEKGQILSVQVSYHPGWQARVAGQPRRVYGDNLGQLVVEPECAGPCKVEVAYDGGLEMRLARVVSWCGLLGGLGWILIDSRKRSARPA